MANNTLSTSHPHVSVDIYNYANQKVCNLYDSESKSPGAAHDLQVDRQLDGWKTLTFTMPYQEDPSHNNYRWSFIRNEYLVRVKKDDWINYFIIHTPKKRHNSKSVENSVTCSDICSTLKTRNLYKEFDGDKTGIGAISSWTQSNTVPPLMAQVLEGSGWRFDEENSVEIYEKSDPTQVKIRSFKSSAKAGCYKMVTDLCALFDCYPVFDSSDLHDLKVRVYPMPDPSNLQGELREVTIGHDLNTLDFEENTEDLITRLYVEGEYGDNGYVGIDDVNVDMPGMSYLLDFSYYREVGLFTQAHETILAAFKANISRAAQDVIAQQKVLDETQASINEKWGQPNAVIYYQENGSSNPQIVKWCPDPELENDQEAGPSTWNTDFEVGDEIITVSSGSRKTMTRTKLETQEQASAYTWPVGAYYGIKFIHCSPQGEIVIKEVGREAKEKSIEELQRKINQTIDEAAIAEYNSQINAIRVNISAIESQLAELYYDAITEVKTANAEKAQLNARKEAQTELESQFYFDMGPMLKDGYWSNQNYIPGQENELYADAVEAMEKLCKPTRKYTVDRVAQSRELGYNLDSFDLNMQVRIYDDKVEVNDIVYVNKVTEYLDKWWQDKVELTNQSITVSGRSLDSILQRITSVVDEVNSQKDVFKKANALSSDGSLYVARLKGTIDVMKNKIVSSTGNWYTDGNGSLMFETVDGGNAMMLSGEGWLVADGKNQDGTWNWRTAATGQGICADTIVTGFLSAERIEAGSITARELSSHAGDSLDLTSNVSINMQVGDKIENQSRSSGENLQPGTTSSMKQVTIAKGTPFIVGAADIDTGVATDKISFRVYLRPSTQKCQAAIKFLYPQGVTAPSPTTFYSNPINAGEEGWATVTVEAERYGVYAYQAEGRIYNMGDAGSSTVVRFHSPKLEYGPPTPYSPSLDDVERKLNQTYLQLEKYGIYLGATEMIEGHKKDDLNNRIKEIKKTQMEVTPELIVQNASRKTTFGNRNFILKSGETKYISREVVYNLSVPMEAGEPYTLSIDMDPHERTSSIWACVSNGSSDFGSEYMFGSSGRQTVKITANCQYASGKTPTDDPEYGDLHIYTSQNLTSLDVRAMLVGSYDDWASTVGVRAWDYLAGQNGYTITQMKNAASTSLLIPGSQVVLGERHQISAEDMRDAGWKEFEDGSYATLYSRTFGIGSKQYPFTVVFTPITPSGTILSPSALDAYILRFDDVTSRAQILSTDNQGLVMGVFDGWGDEAIENADVLAQAAHSVDAAIIDMTERGATQFNVIDCCADEYIEIAGNSKASVFEYSQIYSVKLEHGTEATPWTVAIEESNAYAGVNLLRNGGFETCRYDEDYCCWVPDNWECDDKQGSILPDMDYRKPATHIFVSGSGVADDYNNYCDNSINTAIIDFITNPDYEDSLVWMRSSPCELVNKQPYTFSCYLSAQNIGKVSITVWDAEVGTGNLYNTYATKQEYEYFGEGGKSQDDWKKVEFSFIANGCQRIEISVDQMISSYYTQGKLFVAQCKLESGFFATPYSKCGLDEFDLSNRINEAELKITPDAIVSTVRESKEYKADLEGQEGRMEARWTEQKQTADGIRITATTAHDTAAKASDDLAQQKNREDTWFDFGQEEGLIIGKDVNSKTSKFSTKIDNEGIYFRENKNNVSWITNRVMHIREAEIEQTIKMGPLTGIVDANGIDWIWNS